MGVKFFADDVFKKFEEVSNQGFKKNQKNRKVLQQGWSENSRSDQVWNWSKLLTEGSEADHQTADRCVGVVELSFFSADFDF